MASLSIDPSSALAEKYRGNRQVLEAAVLGRGGDASIDPYSALRALQKLNVADRYEMMQKAMQGQPNPPSIAQQTVAQAQSGGLGAMPVPEQTFNMAGGGLVAFADGGDTDYERLIRETSFEGITPEEREAEIAERERLLAEVSGTDEFYRKRAEQLEGMRGMGPEELQQQRGLAALQAAAALSQGSDLVRGIGAAGAAFGQSYGKALSAANREKRAFTEMQMNLDAARRQEAIGNRKEAIAAADAAEKKRREVSALEVEKNKALLQDRREREKTAATLAAATTKSEKPPSDRMQMYAINLQNAAAELANQGKQAGETDEKFKSRIALESRKIAVERTADQWRDAGAKEADLKMFSEYMKQLTALDQDIMLARSNPEEYAARREALMDKLNALTSNLSPGTGGRATVTDEVPSATNTPPDLSTISGAPKGAKLGRQTDKGWEVFDAKGNLVGYAQ